MRYIACLHPVTVIKNNRQIQVPCGKCDICRNRHSQNWINKLRKERECWQYCYFLTLTYDDEHLPVLHYDSVQNILVDVDNGVMLDRPLSLRERVYAKKRKSISYPNTRDYQLFIKRLRYYFYEHCKQNKLSSNTLRYFLATEYGPTTHRIHAHGIIFFNDRHGAFAANIAAFIHKSWKNGMVDVQAVQGSDKAIQYVAKYCNVDSNKFSLFKTSLLRPKIYFSKSPAIGSLLVNSEVMQKLFCTSSPVMRVTIGTKFQDVPLPLHIKDRLFPLCPRFRSLTHIQRIGVYSVYKWFREVESAEEFAEYVADNLHVFNISLRPCSFEDNILPISNYLLSLVDFNLKDPFSSIKRLWRISRRICMQKEVFNVSLDTYIKHIEDYLNNCDMFNLRKQYEFQESLSKSPNIHPVGSFVYLDNLFVKDFLNYNSFLDVPLSMVCTLQGYGIDAERFYHDKKYRESFNPDTYPDVQAYISKISFAYTETHKVKQKKSYAREHKIEWLQQYNSPIF